jgi:adhesin transport system outer membrane protein
VLKSYSRLFLAGKRQWLDLVNMSREVTENQVSMATVKAMYITAAYRLALHSGNINFEEK